MKKKRTQENPREDKRRERIDEENIDEPNEETMDIYDAEQRNEMLKDDEITSDEAAFMEGRERATKKTNQGPWSEKKETTSVELAQNEYEEE